MDIEGSEWQFFEDIYALPGSTILATQLLVEFHFPGNVSAVLRTFDALLADNFRVFAVEPNYYCDGGCCAKNLVEYAFVKVSNTGEVCTPLPDSLHLPTGC